MTTATQITATISSKTRELLERYVATHGIDKSRLIETALLHHLSELNAIPADVVIPPVIHVSHETGTTILDRIQDPPPPTTAMRELPDD